MGYPFTLKEYFAAYKRLSLELSEQDIQMVIVRGGSYLGNGRFSQGWKFDDSELISIAAPFQTSLIWNRDDKNTIPDITDHPIINVMELDAICLDKKMTAELFPKMSPQTKVISSYHEISQILIDWKLESEDLLVLKKNFETEGRGICIQPVSEIKPDMYENWEGILVQEFCDSSGGIPGFVSGLHDVRVTIFNGKIAESYIRTPAPGELRANTSLGGSYFRIKAKKIPPKLRRLVKNVDAQLSHFPMRAYAIDFFRSSKGWRLIELNSRPGMPYIGDNSDDADLVNYFYKQLIAFFSDAFRDLDKND